MGPIYFTSMTDISKKFVDCGGNIWYMGAWYVPFKYVKFGSEGIYESDYEKFPRVNYDRELSKYPMKFGPKLGPCCCQWIKLISYADWKLGIYLNEPTESNKVIGSLEYTLYLLRKEKKYMEGESIKQQAECDCALGEYQDILTRMTNLITKLIHIIEA